MSGRDKDVVWEHGENLYPGWRCNYCHTQKGGGGATRLKQYLAGRRAKVVHCRNVPPNVQSIQKWGKFHWNDTYELTFLYLKVLDDSSINIQVSSLR